MGARSIVGPYECHRLGTQLLNLETGRAGDEGGSLSLYPAGDGGLAISSMSSRSRGPGCRLSTESILRDTVGESVSFMGIDTDWGFNFMCS